MKKDYLSETADFTIDSTAADVSRLFSYSSACAFVPRIEFKEVSVIH